jgi:hypothetical protein
MPRVVECVHLERETMKQAKLTPRNPLVAAALFRKAGEHRKTAKAQRRQDKMTLGKRLGQRDEPAAASRRSAGFQLRVGGLAAC